MSLVGLEGDEVDSVLSRGDLTLKSPSRLALDGTSGNGWMRFCRFRLGALIGQNPTVRQMRNQ